MRIKLTLILPLLAVAAMTQAAPVSVQRATRVAEGFWASAVGSKAASGLEPVQWQYEGLYLFVSPQGGWMVVSANDCAHAVLAYSTTGTVNPQHMPAAMQHLMQSYSQEVAHIATLDVPKNAEWSQIESGTYSLAPAKDGDDEVGPLLSTTWFQRSPYNMLCPSGCMTGCVATAMAQVLKYWNYPAFGEGSHSYSDDTGYGPLTADFGNTRYDWANMPNRLTSASSAVQKTAVATLMFHCGVSVNMHYSPSESGSTNVRAMDAFKNYFRFNDHTRYLTKGSISNDAWTDTLIAELRLRRPILYGGNGPSGGHSFVCDGFNAQRFLHFNLGEDGQGDGFYRIGAISYGSYSFNSDNDAVLGLRPEYDLYTNPERLGYTRAGGSATLWVSPSDTATSPCRAIASADWITLSQADFSQLEEVTVNVSANNTGDTRIGSVTFTQGDRTTVVEVEQQAYDPATDYCPLTVEMENTHNEPWAGDAYLSFESPSGFVYGIARHTVNARTSTSTVSVAPHDVMVRWHKGGAHDRYINYRVKNSYGEVLVDVQNAYFDGTDVLLSWPCSRLSVDEAPAADSRLWPNPTTGIVTVGIDNGQPVSIVVLDAAGRELLRSTARRIDLSSLSAGIYYLRVLTDSGVQIQKLIKQ